MEWLNHLSAAIAYIEEHLDQEISCEEAARIACCSPGYFQRMFSYVAGISLSEYIRRRRMSQAAFELQRTGAKAVDVALKYGYTSPASFNRAFRQVHGISPAAAKNAGEMLNAYPPIHFSVKITGERPLSYRIEEKPGMSLIGAGIPLTGDMEENQRIVPEFWEESRKNGILEKLCQLSGDKPERIFGISVCDEPERPVYYIGAPLAGGELRGLAGESCGQVGESCGLGGKSSDLGGSPSVLKIPSSLWAVFQGQGDFKGGVQQVFRRFFTEWLPFSGYRYAGLPDVEAYPLPWVLERRGHWEVWFAIEREKEGESGCTRSVQNK